MTGKDIIRRYRSCLKGFEDVGCTNILEEMIDNALIEANKAPVANVLCSDRVRPRVIDKMHIDFERFISSNLNWPIERTGPYYNDKKAAGAWEVFKFAKVA